jgi:hypothetical protein
LKSKWKIKLLKVIMPYNPQKHIITFFGTHGFFNRFSGFHKAASKASPDNSPAFQRWVAKERSAKVPSGTAD